MSTQTQQDYIVHIDIPTQAADPDEAVQDVLTRLRAGSLTNVTVTVDAAQGAVLPIPRPGPREIYRGEFLG